MSTHHIPDPPDFEVNHEVANHEERRRRVLQILDVGDVLAQVDDLIAREPDPKAHPFYGLVRWLLDHTYACDGGDLFDCAKALCLTAIDELVDEALTQGED
jgi:hypothetical protein